MRSRLADLGLEEDDLWAAIQFGVAEASRSTDSEPTNAPGFIRWAKTTGKLRELLTIRGWTRRDEANYPTALGPDGKVAVAVVSGDANTGTEHDPQSRQPHGSATEHVINRNQLQFADFHPTMPRPDHQGADQTWCLVYYEDEETGEVRAELSIPIRMNADGRVGGQGGWQERLILQPPTGQPADRRRTRDDDDDFGAYKADVTRKAS